MLKYTTDELIGYILAFHAKNNKVPSSSQLPVRIETYRAYFGTFNNAILAAGLVPNRTKINKTVLYCKQCNVEFVKRERDQTFCSQSCSATYNNKLRLPKHKVNECKQCNSIIDNSRKFCSIKCCSEYRFKNNEIMIINGLRRDRGALRRYLIRTHGHQCQGEGCGLTHWVGRAIVLELDHIDGNAANNLLTNLRLLCPNCHSMTPTWKAKNKGNGRQSRGMSNC